MSKIQKASQLYIFQGFFVFLEDMSELTQNLGQVWTVMLLEQQQM